jgi:hypothetical protein
MFLVLSVTMQPASMTSTEAVVEGGGSMEKMLLLVLEVMKVLSSSPFSLE